MDECGISFTKIRNRMKAGIFRNQICKYLFFTGTLISLVFSPFCSCEFSYRGFRIWIGIFNSLPSRKPEEADIYTAMTGTL